MPDHGERYTNGKIRRVDRELQGVYRQAEKELKKKLADFLDRYKAKDRQKQRQLENGEITEQEYKSWLKGQVFQKDRLEEKIRQVQKTMYNHNVEAAKIVHENKLDVFAENYNREAFKAEAITNISFNVYNAQAVSKLIKDRPDILPKWNIDQKKDYKWNYRKVNNAITQGIIQGESIDQITSRLIHSLCTQNESKMRMFARTALNSAQSAGRQLQNEEAAKKGIKINKQWLATLDMRTRDTHRHLDGKEVPYDKPFKSDLGDIMFPGDPEAEPANVYNCRCTIVSIYPEYEERGRDWREDETIDGLTYEEWKNEKQEQKGEHQEKGKTVEEIIMEKIRTHEGDWSLDEVIELGKVYTDSVKELTKQEEQEAKEVLDEINNKKAQIKELFKQREGLSGEERRKKEEEISKVQKEQSKLYEKSFEIQKRINKIGYDGFYKLLSSTRELGGIDKDNINKFADFSMFNYEVKKTREAAIEAMNKYPSQWLEASMRYKKVLLHPHWTTARAHYDDSNGEIRLDGDIETGIHELSHRFEVAIPKMGLLEKAFYDRRTAGCKLEWLGPGYRRDEKTRRDSFITPYMGKDYGEDGNFYELCSMGYQHLLNGDYIYFQRDEEMRNWLIGMILTI